MFCFVDESGNTGLNLFDENQPVLYYGVITSKVNLDVVAEPMLSRLRNQLGVERLHANELGVARLSNVALEIAEYSKKRDIRFSLFKVSKPDHAVISFFDQVFDSGMNKAISWQHYFTPLRYVLLFKVAYLFDEEIAQMAWTARQERNPERCSKKLREICSILLDRVHRLPDQRSRELISGGLKWASTNPFEIEYGVGNKDTALQISPNLVGFQQVLQHIDQQAGRQSRKVRSITVDRQTQFNKAQGELADIYQKMKGLKADMGPGMPSIEWSNMPEVPPEFRSSDESAGLELVDLTLWIAKRMTENKPLSPELVSLFYVQAKRGQTDEVSFDGLNRRWKHLSELPVPDEPLSDEMLEVLKKGELDRLKVLQGL
ncbi:MAG: hypothetical protein CMN56_11090 [Sneathiella sp.]|uniref:DUF3800 domain-containing protein n=1 Tax=Sneathiella sp. TaxID=1964365 RepID=UPI000C42B037|nr:DUF3800 domain-containing protein [Sneathiella sp.]MAZ03671.1 hypothetical protein [Sneathiella sp.]